MDKTYIDAVKLMLRIAPDVFAGNPFALKGGTAINLFVREMPRLSVDLDLVYVNRETPRQGIGVKRGRSTQSAIGRIL